MDTTKTPSMKPTAAILENIRQASKKNKEESFTRLYRYLLRPDIYYLAYENLYANNGAATRGINNDTADGFSEKKVQSIIRSLTDGSYTPSPARRTYIPKRNGKMRPLGIPTFTDKLVQEALRMVLESVYEPVFLDSSHGFRPNRSCHTALKTIKHSYSGTRWFVEGDIKGFFDHIDHATLIALIGQKVKDSRITQLLHKMLKAGYLENWQYNRTLSGTPQGGIISPLLANIYLHEFDKFMQNLKSGFDKPKEKTFAPAYMHVAGRVHHISKLLKKETNPDRIRELRQEHKVLRARMLRLPAKSQTDKRIVYVRYADDFLIGVNGSKAECQTIKAAVKAFLAEQLKLELSDEKTLITHSAEYARFLGYDIRVRRNNQIKDGGQGYSQRTLSNRVEMNVPLVDKIERYLFDRKAARWENGALRPIHRGALVTMTDLEILMVYNAELRGICNYYCMASNFGKLGYFAYLMEYSCLMTLASKHKSTLSKIRSQFKDGRGGWCIPYETKQGKKRMYFAKYQDSKKLHAAKDEIPRAVPRTVKMGSSFESRLMAKQCEFCGRTDSTNYEVHHVHKLKDLRGKTMLEQVMISRKRKTIVLCEQCHDNLHNGKA
jgi:group II intron reverse transcriptase/maturase